MGATTPPAAVLAVGDVIDDVVVRPLAVTEQDTDTPAVITRVPGGGAANKAVWLASFGVPVRFVGRVAYSDVDRHTRQFEEAGVDARLIGDPDRPTGRVVVIVDGQGGRTMYSDRAANLGLEVGDLDDGLFGGLLDGLGLVVVSGYTFLHSGPRAAARDLVERAAAAGIPVAVDPASVGFLRAVGPSSFCDWIGQATVVLPNLAEGQLLTRASTVDGVVDGLLARFPIVALKLGPRGAVVAERDGVRAEIPAADVEVLDPTGAGDAFAGGFLAAWYSGEDLEAAGRAGVAAAARAVAGPGGRFGAVPDGGRQDGGRQDGGEQGGGEQGGGEQGGDEEVRGDEDGGQEAAR